MLNLKDLPPERLDEFSAALVRWHETRVANAQMIADRKRDPSEARAAMTTYMDASRELHGLVLKFVRQPAKRRG